MIFVLIACALPVITAVRTRSVVRTNRYSSNIGGL